MSFDPFTVFAVPPHLLQPERRSIHQANRSMMEERQRAFADQLLSLVITDIVSRRKQAKRHRWLDHHHSYPTQYRRTHTGRLQRIAHGTR